MLSVTTGANPIRRRWLTRAARPLSAALILLAASCGASEPVEPQPGATIAVDSGPRVAPARFDGDFTISELVVAGEPVPLQATAMVSIETEFGALSVSPACNTFLGSFTLIESDETESNLSDDGQASFTVAGGSSDNCDDLDEQERAVLAAMAAVDSWVSVDDGFRFDGPDGSSFTITR